MRHKTLAGLTAALMVSTAPIAVSATELVINHGWSSPAEVAALNVLREGLEERGHSWVDLALPHDTGADVGLINLITGGNPPNVFMESAPDVYRDMNAMGLGQPLTDFFADQDITPHLADHLFAGSLRLDARSWSWQEVPKNAALYNRPFGQRIH